jgi:hypothetical protein
MANAPFYEPTVLTQEWDLATSQTSKVMTFTFGDGVTAKAGSKVVFEYNGRKVHEYTVGDGITLSAGDTVATVTLNGNDFTSEAGHTVTATCSFVTPGDPEIIFSLNIVKSLL